MQRLCFEAPEKIRESNGRACATHYQQPLLVCDVHDVNTNDKIREWLAANGISTLNVAGPAESTSPGTGGKAYALLTGVFQS